MKTRNITISKKKDGTIQRLSEILPMIPRNSILYKLITGIGATFTEIKSLRHSIILEPNVPTIKCKCEDPEHKEDNLFGIYEGIYTEDVIDYIERSFKSGKWIKLMTTPESFYKIKRAFEELDLDLYSLCFFMFDECHRLIKDVDYREDIAIPMEDFFLFENKAFVSATPILSLDPRFKEQGFELINIVPDFEYKKPIKLLHTNNTLEALREVLSTIDTDKKVCLLVNSTDMIYQLISKLCVMKDSTVFCAEKSVVKLNEKEFNNAYDEFKKERMNKYNWFTNRFGNGLDIKLDEYPEVIFVTDTFFAEYTMVDAKTDAIQFIGRFRNGISNAIHIFNTNKELPVRKRTGIIDYLKGSRNAYRIIKGLYDCATSKESRNAYKAALDMLPFNRMLSKIGKVNYFMIDNYIDEALLKSAYNNQESVINSYKDSLFIPEILHTKTKNGYYYRITDYDRLKLERKYDSIKDSRKEIVSQLEELKEDMDSELVMSYIEDLRNADPFIVEAYEVIGKEEIEHYKYSSKRIKEVMIYKKYETGINGTEFLQLVKNSFKVGKKYRREYIKKELNRIYKLIKIAPRKAITANTIKEFFETEDCKIQNHKALRIIESII